MITIKRFTASWCTPCKQLGPILEDIKPNFPSATFEVIDVDDHPEVIDEYNFRSIPTVIILKDGIEVTRFSGLKQKLQILKIINESL